MQLEIHPKAAASFSERIDELKYKLLHKTTKSPSGPNSIDPNIPIAAVFDDTNMFDLSAYETSSSGARIERTFRSQDREIGFFDDDYVAFSKLAVSVHKGITPHQVISVERVEEALFKFLENKYKGSPEEDFVEFLDRTLNEYIVECEIWIPVSHLRIQSSFQIGHIVFKTITKSFMDSEEERALSEAEDAETGEALKHYFKRRRNEIQGLAAATMMIEAEPSLAYEIVSEHTEKALGVLRFFSPVNLSASEICYVAPIETQHMDADNYLVIKDDQIISEFTGVRDPKVRDWQISDKRIGDYFSSGLAILSEYLLSEKLADLQESVLSAIGLYSNACLAKDLSLRLVIILAATESLFLQDTSESIGENIALRSAQLHFVDVDKRLKIMKNFRSIYDIRSKFVHHGQTVSIEHRDELETFMHNIWLSLQGVIIQSRERKSREEFFDYLTKRKVGG